MKADKEYIKSIVSMQDIMQLYNLEPQRNKKYICPFHTEKTPSASIKGDIFHCFGCGVTLDVFGFVQQMNNCDFPVALDFICSSFGIQNDGEPDPEFNKRLQERQKAARERERLRDAGQYAYNRLCAYRRYLAALEPDNVERCHMLDYVDYLLDEYLSDMEGVGREIPDVDLYIKRIRRKWAG